MFVLGTAGHIDHGKSSLIKAMTGIDPDRLQERLRAIDQSGYAWTVNEFAEDVAGVVDAMSHGRMSMAALLREFRPLFERYVLTPSRPGEELPWGGEPTSDAVLVARCQAIVAV